MRKTNVQESAKNSLFYVRNPNSQESAKNFLICVDVFTRGEISKRHRTRVEYVVYIW